MESHGANAEIAELPRETSCPYDKSLAAVVGSAVYLTLRNQTEAARRQSAASVAGCDDAVIGETLDGVITSWSAGAERVFGYTAADVIGRSAFMLVPPERAHELPSVLKQLRRGVPVDRLDTVRVCKDGRLIDVALALAPVRDPAGVIVGIWSKASDSSKRQHADEALRSNLPAPSAPLPSREVPVARPELSKQETWPCT